MCRFVSKEKPEIKTKDSNVSDSIWQKLTKDTNSSRFHSELFFSIKLVL